MNKYLQRLALFMSLMFCGISGYASGLEIVSDYFSFLSREYKYYYPLNFMYVMYMQPVYLAEGATGRLVGPKGIIVEKPLVLIEGYEPDGYVHMVLDETYNLPTGTKYCFEIDANSIFSVADPSKSNDMIRIEFEVPTFLEHWHSEIEQGDILEKLRKFELYYRTEIDDSAKFEVELWREGKCIRRLKGSSGWDFGMGVVNASAGDLEDMYLEKGVHYSYYLVPNVVTALDRTDIGNAEVEIEFIGASDQFEYLTHSGLEKVVSDGLLDSVVIIYDRPLTLIEDSEFELTFDGKVISVPCEVYNIDGKGIVRGEVSMIGIRADNREVKIRLPYASVIQSEGSLSVNSEVSASIEEFNETSGIGGIETTGMTVETIGGTLVVKGVGEEIPVSLYTCGGVCVGTRKSAADSICFENLRKGIYLLSINGVFRKVQI